MDARSMVALILFVLVALPVGASERMPVASCTTHYQPVDDGYVVKVVRVGLSLIHFEAELYEKRGADLKFLARLPVREQRLSTASVLETRYTGSSFDLWMKLDLDLEKPGEKEWAHLKALVAGLKFDNRVYCMSGP